MKTVENILIETFNKLEEIIVVFITTKELDYQRVPVRRGKISP